ncbi:MAG: phosphoribosylglycinamide formyltransferase [Bacteroidetes bacterium]|nr:phosphoribosylglycinamide formyltransferase [Bacteroidota bacterium]
MNLWESGSLNIAYFVSGSGSNFQNLEDYFREKFPKASGKLVISDKAGIGAQERAENLGIPFIILKPALFSSQEAYEHQLISLLKDNNIHLICLAGYLKKLPVSLIESFRHRIVNIHPALLPSFGGKGMYGIHIHRAVIEKGCKITGVTLHFVTENYDEGPIILQEAVPVLQEDTPEELQKRVLTMEHQLYPMAVELISTQPWTVTGNTFKLTDPHEKD